MVVFEITLQILLEDLSDFTRFYSMNTFMGKGVISDNSPTHMGTIGIKESDYALHALKYGRCCNCYRI